MAGRLYRKRSAGPWYGWYYTPDGKQHCFCTRQLDKDAARRILRERERATVTPGVPAHETRPLEEALRYLVEHANTKDWAPSTRVMFQRKGGHLLRLLGSHELATLDTQSVQGYISARLSEKAARETVRKELSVLRAALREAKTLGWQVPTPSVIPEFRVKYVPRETHLTRTQFGELLATLSAERRLWVTVAVYAGGRLSELERLDWGDVNLAAGWIRVRGTKTAKARRHVPVPGPLLGVLCQVPKKQRTGPVIGEWGNVRRDLAAACKRAGVPRVSPNDLRRTYASWLKQAGTDSAVVAKLLGHTSTRMVDLVYGRLADETLSAAVESLPPVPGSKWVVEPRAKRAKQARMSKSKRAVKSEVPEEKEEDPRVPRAGIEPATRGFSVPVQDKTTTRLHLVLPRTAGRR